MNQHAVAAVVVIALAATLPLAATAEHFWPGVWTSRLAVPQINDEPARHETKFSEGYFLPPQITRDTTLTPKQNPIVLPATTIIERGVTLTLEPGTKIHVNEFGTLKIEGKLLAPGTAARPIVFATNELNENNQTWDGLIFAPDSQGNLSHVEISAAYPSVSALQNSSVAITNSHLFDTSTSIFSQNGRIFISDTRINATRYGIVTQGQTPQTVRTNIFAGLEQIKHIK